MIIINCTKCEKRYEIVESLNKKDIELDIKYAKCTYCGNPRDNRYLTRPIMIPKDKGTCNICSEPAKNIKYNLCRNHYIAKWKKEHNYSEYMRQWRRKRKLLQNQEVINLE